MLSKKKSFLENVSLIFGCLGQVKNYPSTEKKKKKKMNNKIIAREKMTYTCQETQVPFSPFMWRPAQVPPNYLFIFST